MVVAQHRKAGITLQRLQMKRKVESLIQCLDAISHYLKGNRQCQLIQPRHLVADGLITIDGLRNSQPARSKIPGITHKDEASIEVCRHHLFRTGRHDTCIWQVQPGMGI
ncbi:hypothetical protein D9M70_375100 [compost metagenome]